MLATPLTPRQARLLAEKTQQQMAKALMLSRVGYGIKEREPGRFTVYEALLFCRITNTTLDQVFGGNKA